MYLTYDFNDHQAIVNARFVGLDGTESVSSVKGALELLRVRNPAVLFAEAVKRGKFNDVSDAEYQRMLRTVEVLSALWHNPGETRKDQQKYEMNALTLLANALEALSWLSASSRTGP